MYANKLSLHDFEEVGIEELLEAKGGYAPMYSNPNYDPGGTGGGKGDTNHEGAYDADEVEVWGTRGGSGSSPFASSVMDMMGGSNSGPMMHQSPPQQTGGCAGCSYNYNPSRVRGSIFSSNFAWAAHVLGNTDSCY